MQSLRGSLMFAPRGACNGVTDAAAKAACLKNVQPIIDIGQSSLFDYYETGNWNADGSGSLATPLTLSGKPSIYILGYPSVSHPYIKPLTVKELADAVTGVINDPVNQLPRFDKAGLGMRDLEAALDSCCRRIAAALIKEGSPELKVDADSFGKDASSCVEYFTDHSASGADITYLNRIKLYAALSQDKVEEGAKTSALSAARVYYAFRYIDRIFPAGEDRFFLADRLVTLTKVMYVCMLIRTARQAGTAAGAATSGLDGAFLNLIAWLYKRDIETYVRSDESSDSGLDDMFQRNVQKSQAIRSNSEALVGKQRTVEGIQNNMRSMEHGDQLLRRNKRNLTIAYCVMLALGAALVGGLAYCTATGRTTEMYVTVAAVSMLVLALEAFKGLQRLLAA